MVILFKECPRCGGDVDTTYRDDIYCVQCAYRPPATDMEPSLSLHGSGVSNDTDQSLVQRTDNGRLCPMPVGVASNQQCPKCGSSEAIRLDKLRSRDNTCYRCKSCGHIFSPVENRRHREREATTT